MDISRIHWLGHASFRIDGSRSTIYVDPWKLSGGPVADLILVTHEHFDHLSVEDIAMISDDSTVVVGSASCREGLRRTVADRALRIVEPGDEISVSGIGIRAVPAYNTQPDRQGFHPLDTATPRVGYVVDVDGTTIYHTGDTDSIDEMKDLSPDFVLIPVGGTYTMDAAQAAEAAHRMQARAAVPMHFGDIVGTREDADRFAELFDGITHIIEPE